MKKNKFFIPQAIVLSIFVFTSAMFASPADTSRKIVVFQKNFSNQTAQTALLKKHGAVPNKPLRIINAMSVSLPAQALDALNKRLGDEIIRIDDDILVKGSGKPTKLAADLPPQEMPWGMERIGADIAWVDSTGSAVNVAILDTGVDLDHQDLAANIKGNYNAINPRKSAQDDHGHGTHVTGIIAAMNNETGVVGVGPQVNIYAVKVLDRTNQGNLSDILDGLQWCIDNHMQVINMSFGTLFSNLSLQDAVIAIHNAGITQVAAAGNTGGSGGAILYPAKYPETIAVSSVGSSNQLSGSSSRGAEIDLAAPGVQINSTYNDGLYTTMSGTSMAAPHVTGAAALVLSLYGTLTPDEVKEKLKSTAEDLGLPSIEQGAGLVRADSAVF